MPVWNETAEAMGRYYKNHQLQSCRPLVQDDILMEYAWWKAKDMATRQYFEHQTPEGRWPNGLVRGLDYDLPDWYADDSNQVESIAMGYMNYMFAIDALFKSKSHRNHMAGVGFWKDHSHYGVGLEEVWRPDRNVYDRYYVVVTAPEEIELHWQWLPVIKQGVIAPQERE